MIAPEPLLDGRVRLHVGDMAEVLATLPEASVDSVVCDPPYHLTSIVKRFGGKGAAAAKHGTDGAFARASRGFMGQTWDGGDVAFRVETWAAVLRVLKPGGHLVAFGAAKNFGFMQVAIAGAGFEIRDVVAWLFATGFPKNHDVGNGMGTALKPAYEPIILARKPLSEGSVAANMRRWGVGAININACRIETSDRINQPSTKGTLCGDGGWDRPWKHDVAAVAARDARARDAIAKAEGLGRFPANVVHDGSDEVVAAFRADAGAAAPVLRRNADKFRGTYGAFAGNRDEAGSTFYGDSGSAARFFFSAKADSDDRLGSKHPTVKPVDLMQWLVRLVTPPKGVVLDPFAGTGTTGEAAWREGFDAILIEREPAYAEDIRRRMALALAGPQTRKAESIKARGTAADAGPLFSGGA